MTTYQSAVFLPIMRGRSMLRSNTVILVNIGSIYCRIMCITLFATFMYSVQSDARRGWADALG